MTVIDTAQKFRDELEALDEEALLRISKAYARIFRNLQGSIDALMLEIASLDNPTQSQIFKLERYRRLINQITDELTTFQAYLKTEILSAAELSFATSNKQAQALLAETLAGITTQFGNLPTDAFEVLVGFLKEGSPLYARIDELAKTTADYVINQLLDGVALGKNPRTVASLIGDAFGRGLTDALRLARTAQLYAGRVATLANYQNNSDVLDGWVWFAQIGDPSTCQSCIVQHGTIHQLDELLNDHHNGRCAMIPYIEEFGNPVEETGIQWFENLPEAQQRAILGQGKYDLWKAGKFTLDKLSRDVENDVYGDMKNVTPLWVLEGKKSANE